MASFDCNGTEVDIIIMEGFSYRWYGTSSKTWELLCSVERKLKSKSVSAQLLKDLRKTDDGSGLRFGMSQTQRSAMKDVLKLDDGLAEVIEAVAKGDIRDFRKAESAKDTTVGLSKKKDQERSAPNIDDALSTSGKTVGSGSLSDGADLPSRVSLCVILHVHLQTSVFLNLLIHGHELWSTDSLSKDLCLSWTKPRPCLFLANCSLLPLIGDCNLNLSCGCINLLWSRHDRFGACPSGNVCYCMSWGHCFIVLSRHSAEEPVLWATTLFVWDYRHITSRRCLPKLCWGGNSYGCCCR